MNMRAGLTFLIDCYINYVNGCEKQTQDPVVGGSLLLTYTTGYVAPIIPAASFARALQVIMCTIVFNK